MIRSSLRRPQEIALRKLGPDPFLVHTRWPAGRWLVDHVAKADCVAACLSMEADPRLMAVERIADQVRAHKPASAAFAAAVSRVGVARDVERAAAIGRLAGASGLAAQAEALDRMFLPQTMASAAWELERERVARRSGAADGAWRLRESIGTVDGSSRTALAFPIEPSPSSVAEDSRRSSARGAEDVDRYLAMELDRLNAGLRRRDVSKSRVVNVTCCGEWTKLEQHELGAKLEASPELVPCACNPCELVVFKATSEIEGDAQLLTVKFVCDACGCVKEVVRWPSLREATRGLHLLPSRDRDDAPAD